MLRKKIMSWGLAGCLAALILTPAVGGAADELHRQLFTVKCSKCHSADKIKQFHGNQQQLLKLLQRMSGKHGAEIKPEDLEKIDEYILSLDLTTGSG
ncbi:MAG TPA: hypothetical protein ENN66_07505 [Proteobacteria bacterium]|nr:hypothetical protein [Pseudomonadota bacterium]